MRAAMPNALPGPHRWLLGCGLAALMVAWLGPLPALARHSFAAHMAMHMTVVAIAAPLIACGIAGSRLDPVRYGMQGWRVLLWSPILASVVEFIVVWAWHAPAMHHAARVSTVALLLEQGSFLTVGLLVWLAAFGGNTQCSERTAAVVARRSERAAAGVAGLLLTSMHMTLLGVLLALAPRVLYPHHGSMSSGLGALQDQQLGGVLMLAFGGVAYLAGALVLLRGLLRRPQEACR